MKPRTQLAVLFLIILCGAVSAQELNTEALRYRYIGPMGNRLTSVAGVPGQPDVYYVGAASGGVWKTTDGGVHWEPVFDGPPEQRLVARGGYLIVIREARGIDVIGAAHA